MTLPHEKTPDAPSVSVVIPSYNRQSSIVAAVRSVLSQDYRDIEVIVSDDGSTDGTIAALNEIDDGRLHVVSNPGERGVSMNRNHGVNLAKGDWIAFQDSDDLWLPGKLSSQMKRLTESGKQPDFVAAYCGMLVKESSNSSAPVLLRHPDPSITPLDGDILPSLVEGSYLSTQMLVIRRDIFDQVGGFDERLPALVDWELMLRIAQCGLIAFVDEDLVVQRMSDNSITHSNINRVIAQERILEKHYDLLSKFPGVTARHHHRISGAYRKLGRYDTALLHATSAFRRSPQNPKYFANVVYIGVRSSFLNLGRGISIIFSRSRNCGK